MTEDVRGRRLEEKDNQGDFGPDFEEGVESVESAEKACVIIVIQVLEPLGEYAPGQTCFSGSTVLM